MRARTMALAITIALLAGAGTASAHDTRYRTASSFAFDSHFEDFLGFVSSSKAGCVKGRTVKLYLVRSGRDRLVGRDRSGVPTGSGDGHWVVDTNLRNGKRYYAKVTKKNIGPRGHRHICRPYRTSTLRYRD